LRLRKILQALCNTLIAVGWSNALYLISRDNT
jgi:hypothetical protein